MEVWGGVEYTHNRVRDVYLDQMDFSGHSERPSDYGLFRDLGIRTLRVGLLWERHEEDPTWAWEDRTMGCLRELGIRPIAGLVHHGSGPAHTSLLDPEFAEKLAAYAGEVAARYPWVDAYTPVNEPNTTARFSCLYGFWYPHRKCLKSYLRALLHEMRGTVLSMRAIRKVNPAAKLIQTDDAGRIWSTPELSATCDLLNERRWLQIDLLRGMVDRGHPLFDYMVQAGIGEAEILWFAENPCPPDVVGINYYLTSDRFLDHRMERHPGIGVCDDGPFLNLDALRMRQEGISGYGPLLMESAERFGLPTAITEVHLGSEMPDVESQIRWVVEAWEGAQRANEAGAGCIAMTLWALLGSFHWNRLVTCTEGFYEAGVFDISSGEPRPTELAAVVAQLARGERPRHPALAERGWWHDPSCAHDLVLCE